MEKGNSSLAVWRRTPSQSRRWMCWDERRVATTQCKRRPFEGGRWRRRRRRRRRSTQFLWLSFFILKHFFNATSKSAQRTLYHFLQFISMSSIYSFCGWNHSLRLPFKPDSVCDSLVNTVFCIVQVDAVIAIGNPSLRDFWTLLQFWEYIRCGLNQRFIVENFKIIWSTI